MRVLVFHFLCAQMVRGMFYGETRAPSVRLQDPGEVTRIRHLFFQKFCSLLEKPIARILECLNVGQRTRLQLDHDQRIRTTGALKQAQNNPETRSRTSIRDDHVTGKSPLLHYHPLPRPITLKRQSPAGESCCDGARVPRCHVATVIVLAAQR